MNSPLIQVLAILALLPFCAVLGRTWRLVLLTAGGAVLMLATAPAAFWIVLLTIVEAFVLERALRHLERQSLVRQYVPYVLLLNLFTTDVAHAIPSLDLLTAGVAFAVVRVFMTTKQLLGSAPVHIRHRVAPLALAGFFLPVIAIGPIVSGVALWNQRTSTEPEHRTEALYRMLFSGWLLATLVASWMSQLSGGDHLGRATAPLVLLALFGNLFASFWGQSLIAEAGAALAGFTVPRNFDKPWLAKDFREFWNRWHISMAKFVTQYVFLPLNLRKVPPKIATVASFTFMGLWHEVRPGYVIWGVCHGLLMAFAPTTAPDASLTRRTIGRVTTLSTVVILSYTANYAF